MPSVTGYTAAKMQQIANMAVQSASVIAGHLIITRVDGSTFDAGDVRSGEQIPHTNTNMVTVSGTPVGTNVSTFNNLQIPLSVSGFVKTRSDTKLVVEYAGGIYNSNDLGQYEVAVNLAGVNRVIANGYSNLGQKSGILTISGITAGIKTFSLYYRRANGVGTVYDGTPGTRNCLKVTETF